MNLGDNAVNSWSDEAVINLAPSKSYFSDNNWIFRLHRRLEHTEKVTDRIDMRTAVVRMFPN